MQSVPSPVGHAGHRAAAHALVFLLFASAVWAEPGPATEAAESTQSHWYTFSDNKLMEALGADPDDSSIFRLGYWQTTLDLGANGNTQTTRSPDYPDTKYYSYLTEEGITVHNQGFYLIDPRLLTGDASVRFAFQQARQDAQDIGTSQQGDVTDYYVVTTLFPEMPYTATFAASRAEYVTSQAGGGTTASAGSNLNATLFWRETSFLRDREIAPFFSTSLQAAREHLEETTTNAGQQFRRDEQRDRLRLDGHNGFDTADLSFSFEDTDVENLAFPQGSYHGRNADISYSADFGANLNRHSDSHLNYDERSGDFDVSTLDFDQRVFIEHNSFLSSNYYYAYLSTDSPVGSTTTQRADAGVQYRPFLNVSTNLDLFGSRTALDTGQIDTAGTYLGVSYDHGLPWSGQLSTSVGGGVQFSDSQLESAQVPIINAPYQAPPQLGAGAGFVLNERDVVAETIIVVNVRGGARLPTSESIDYIVVVEGNRTTIVPLASSTVIQGGDPLEVSYLYLVDPSLESRTTTQSFFVSADWQWIAVSLTHDVTRQVPLSGQQDTLLSDQDRSSLRLDLRRDWQAWQGRANAMATRYRDERLMYDEVRLNESLWWRPTYDWQLGLDASQSESKFLLSNRRSQYQDARFSATWHSAKGWWLDGYLSYRALDDTELLTETVKEGFFRIRRNWPQLTFTCAVGVGQRERGQLQTTYENIQLDLTRLF